MTSQEVKEIEAAVATLGKFHEKLVERGYIYSHHARERSIALEDLTRWAKTMWYDDNHIED